MMLLLSDPAVGPGIDWLYFNEKNGNFQDEGETLEKVEKR
jgi:hypothetical protein